MAGSLESLRSGLETHEGDLATLCEDVGRRADQARKEMVEFKEKVPLSVCIRAICTRFPSGVCRRRDRVGGLIEDVIYCRSMWQWYQPRYPVCLTAFGRLSAVARSVGGGGNRAARLLVGSGSGGRILIWNHARVKGENSSSADVRGSVLVPLFKVTSTAARRSQRHC